MILEKDEDGLLISPCRECIFATFEQTQPWHKKQTGCLFDRVEKFKERGTRVEWRDGDAVSSYEIHTFCNNLRGLEWLKEQDSKDLSKAMDQCYEDNKLQYLAIIYSKNIECIEEIKQSLNDILKQEILPQKIIISTYNKELDYPRLITEVRSSYDSKIPLSFSRVLEDKYERYIIDHCLSDVKFQSYLAVLAGTPMKSDMMKKLNDLINVDCKLVSIAKNHDGSLLYVSTILHNELCGNSEGTLEINERKETHSRIEDKLVAISEEYRKTVVEL